MGKYTYIKLSILRWYPIYFNYFHKLPLPMVIYIILFKSIRYFKCVHGYKIILISNTDENDLVSIV